MSTQTYTVTGMTCDHCSRFVRAEVSAVAGVTAVDVDLATGTVTVTSEQPVGPDTIREAVEEAGYALASLTRRSGGGVARPPLRRSAAASRRNTIRTAPGQRR